MISQGGLLVFGTFDPSGFKALPLDFSEGDWPVSALRAYCAN